MAASDYVVADRVVDGGFPVTAADKVAETTFDNPDTQARAAADSAGVSNAAYIGYAAALTAYNNREDIEALVDRRARENGTTFAAGDFMRAKADGTPPSPGTPDGKADRKSVV